MFYLLTRLFGFWGILDAFLLAINPRAWNNSWRKRLEQMSNKGFLSRLFALSGLLFSFWLAKRTPKNI